MPESDYRSEYFREVERMKISRKKKIELLSERRKKLIAYLDGEQNEVANYMPSSGSYKPPEEGDYEYDPSDDDVYNQAIRDHYANDPERIAHDKAIQSYRTANTVAYIAKCMAVGWITGEIIGFILAVIFVYYFFIEPWILPILKYLFGHH